MDIKKSIGWFGLGEFSLWKRHDNGIKSRDEHIFNNQGSFGYYTTTTTISIAGALFTGLTLHKKNKNIDVFLGQKLRA